MIDIYFEILNNPTIQQFIQYVASETMNNIFYWREDLLSFFLIDTSITGLLHIDRILFTLFSKHRSIDRCDMKYYAQLVLHSCKVLCVFITLKILGVHLREHQRK